MCAFTSKLYLASGEGAIQIYVSFEIFCNLRVKFYYFKNLVGGTEF